MGIERSAKHYDEGYRTNPKYKLDADHAPWSQLWYWVLSRTGEEMLVDLGCGVGHLASLLDRRNHPAHLYLGVDFSEEALRQARERVPGYRFVCDTLPQAAARAKTLLDATVVFCEVLEHFKEDRAAIALLSAGTRVLATVPQQDSKGHVRHFTRMTMVCRRYEDLLEIRSVERIGRAYAFEGTRRQG